MKNMPSMNLYLDEKTKKQLKDLAKVENRSPSKQVKHMMEHYLEYKKKLNVFCIDPKDEKEYKKILKQSLQKYEVK